MKRASARRTVMWRQKPMGQARYTPPPAGGPALPERLPAGCHLPRTWRRCRLGHALCRHSGHAGPSRRDQPQGRQGRPRSSAARPSRLAHHRQAHNSQEYHLDPAAIAFAPSTILLLRSEGALLSPEASRTSGKICGQTGSQTESSKGMTTSSMPHATPGTSSPRNQAS